jgi:hypothetical protein
MPLPAWLLWDRSVGVTHYRAEPASLARSARRCGRYTSAARGASGFALRRRWWLPLAASRAGSRSRPQRASAPYASTADARRGSHACSRTRP